MKSYSPSTLSKLANTTVRTLHHYDNVGLLKPTFRNEKGYRAYSESDFEKLRKIGLLKLFRTPLKDMNKALSSFGQKNSEILQLQKRNIEKDKQQLILSSHMLMYIEEQEILSQPVDWEVLDQIRYYCLQSKNFPLNDWLNLFLTKIEQEAFKDHQKKLGEKGQIEYSQKWTVLFNQLRLLDTPEDADFNRQEFIAQWRALANFGMKDYPSLSLKTWALMRTIGIPKAWMPFYNEYAITLARQLLISRY
ncbi:MerR family transcriptional regulator [Cysteiniphilum halobium]|uniref:MerR family transcriptional regulator n=1 Tax=Cysteiniphilum halobium TaxID=2219059 RepID=UPI000E652596|nr:MerR family transcriptional regulator [Cysteiniphilum halobium]